MRTGIPRVWAATTHVVVGLPLAAITASLVLTAGTVAALVAVTVVGAPYALRAFLTVVSASTSMQRTRFAAMVDVKLDVDTQHGTRVGWRQISDIKILAGTDGEVRVERNLRWIDDQPGWTEKWTGETFTISHDCGGRATSDECSIRYTVLVPAGVQVEAETASGDISLSNLTGEIRVTSTSGDVWMSSVSGPLTIRAASGDVTISYA